MNSNLSPEQMKGLISVHRRINNLLNEAEGIRQGGVAE